MPTSSEVRKVSEGKLSFPTGTDRGRGLMFGENRKYPVEFVEKLTLELVRGSKEGRFIVSSPLFSESNRFFR